MRVRIAAGKQHAATPADRRGGKRNRQADFLPGGRFRRILYPDVIRAVAGDDRVDRLAGNSSRSRWPAGMRNSPGLGRPSIRNPPRLIRSVSSCTSRPSRAIRESEPPAPGGGAQSRAARTIVF